MGNRLRKLSGLFVSLPPLAHTSALPSVEFDNRNLVGHSELLLTPCQKKFIKESWAKIKANRRRFGQDAYLRVFQVDPNLKVLFLWDDVPTHSLVLNPGFQHQADMIISVIFMCIRKIDHLETQVHAYLTELGRRHCRFQEYGFTPFHWELFQQSIILSLAQELCHSVQNAAKLDAWELFIKYIVDTMKIGYQLGIEELKANKKRLPQSECLLKRPTRARFTSVSSHDSI